MKTAVVQLTASTDFDQNIEKTLHFCTQAFHNGAQFVALPELFSFRGPNPVGEAIPGPSTTPLIALARHYKGWILAGSVCEALAGESRVYNTSVMIGPDGIVATYRKTHCFDALVDGIEIRESRTFLTGTTPCLTEVAGVKTGLSICFDLRFSELFLGYVTAGAQLLCIPSAFTTPTGKAHWEVLVRARAIETQCFVVAPNQVGVGAYPTPSYGHSLIVDPWGTVLARGDDQHEGVWIADLDFIQVDKVRGLIPLCRGPNAVRQQALPHQDGPTP